MANILVCDDDREIVDAIEIYLSQDGYKIYKAYDGEQAIQILDKEDIHLLIMDIMMPRLDGIRATLKIREYSSIPIIILSAKSEDTDKILGLNIGADDYICKPFNPLELVARVKSNLRRYTSLGSLTGENKAIYQVGGLILNDDRLTHIQLRAFACRDPVFAALACHFIGQRDTLGLGGQDHIKLRRLFQQSSGAGLGQLHIAEHDKSSNVQVIIDLADGQFTGQARDMQCIGICHDGFTSPYFYKCAAAFGISPEAKRGCAWPTHESAGASRSGRRPHLHW